MWECVTTRTCADHLLVLALVGYRASCFVVVVSEAVIFPRLCFGLLLQSIYAHMRIKRLLQNIKTLHTKIARPGLCSCEPLLQFFNVFPRFTLRDVHCESLHAKWGDTHLARFLQLHVLLLRVNEVQNDVERPCEA